MLFIFVFSQIYLKNYNCLFCYEILIRFAWKNYCESLMISEWVFVGMLVVKQQRINADSFKNTLLDTYSVVKYEILQLDCQDKGHS